MAMYKITEDVLSKTVNEEEVIVNLNTGTYYGLNETGTVIWNHLKKGSHKDDILLNLCEIFDASADDLKKDMDQFLGDLKNHNMISEF